MIYRPEPLDVKHTLIGKAFNEPEQEGWVDEEGMKSIYEWAKAVGALCFEPIRWYKKGSASSLTWVLEFHGEDKQIAAEQRGRKNADELDPDEIGWAFIHIFIRLNTGKAYRIETDATQ